MGHLKVGCGVDMLLEIAARCIQCLCPTKSFLLHLIVSIALIERPGTASMTLVLLGPRD